MTEMDNRVLSMSFDNSDFEKHMAQSIQTLDNFDKSINKIDGKSLESLTKAANDVKLDGISSAALAVEKSFTTMEIVGMTVIQNLTNAVINFGRSLWYNTIGQIKSGGMKRALNIEQASFLLEGLGLDVKQIKEDAMYAVEGTAYGFDEAAKAAASFAASGVKAGDEMKKSLLGVSGVAAMTGRDYQNISDIFTTIASNGKLMTMQLRQFSNAGLNVSAVLAKQLGKTEAEINKMVEKGKIDFKTFSEAMNEAFGEHAKDANKTFTGSLSNMKAALSRIGEAFATPYIENMIPVLNTLRDVINQIKTDLGPFIKDFELISKIVSTLLVRSLNNLKDSGKIEKIFLSIRNVITSLVLILNEVGKAFREVFPNSKGFIDIFYKITKALIPSKEALDGFREIMKTVFVVMRIGVILFTNALKIIASLILYLNKWIQQTISLAAEFKKFLDPFIKWVNESKIVEKTIYVVIGIIVTLGEKIQELKQKLEVLSSTNTTINNFFSDIWLNVKKFVNGLIALISQVDLATTVIIAFAIGMIFVIEAIRQKFITGFRVFTGFFFNILEIVKGVANTIKSFNYLLKNIANMFKKMSLSFLADIILKIAISVGILSLSLTLLSKIKVEGILKAGGALIFLFGILIGSYAALQKISENQGFFKLVSTSAILMSLSIAIVTLALSMKLLSTIDVKNGLISGIAGMLTIAGIIVGVSLLAKDIKIKGIIGLGIGFELMATAITKIAKVAATDKSALDKAIEIMGLLAVIIGSMMFVSNILDRTKGIKSAGFVLFGLSIDILANAITKVANIAIIDPNALYKAIDAIIILSIVIGAMMTLSNLLNKTKGIKSAGFVLFGLSIDLLANAISKVANIAITDSNALYKAIDIIVILSIVMSSMTILSNFLNKTKGIKSAGFVWFALSISVLASALKTVTKLASNDDGSVDKALQIILGLTGIVVGMMILSDALNKTKGISASGFFMFSFCVWILSQSLAVLANIYMRSSDALDNALFSLSMLTVIIILMMALSTKMSGIKSDGFRKFSASILVLSIAMDILANAFHGEGGWNDMFIASSALLLMVGIMWLMMKIASKANNLKVRGIFTMASAMLILSAALSVISLLDYKKILVGAGAISVMAVAMGLASKLAKESFLAAIGVSVIAASMIALASAIYILKDVDSNQIFEIAAILAVFAVVISVINDVSSEKFSVGVLGFLALAGGIVILASALRMLAAVPVSDIIAISACLVGLTIVFGALGALASINVIAAGLVILSACLLALSASALMFASAVSIFLKSITDFIDKLISLKDISSESIQHVLDNLEQLIYGITLLAPKIGNAITALLMAVGGAIFNAAPIMALGGATIIVYLITGILEMIPTLLDSFSECLISINDWAEAHGEELYNAGYNIGYRIMKGMFSALEGAAYGFYEYMDENLLPAWGVTTSKVQLEEDAKKFAESWRKNFFDALKKDDGRSQEAAEAIINGLNIGIEKGYISYEEASAKLAEIGLNAFKEKLDIHSPSGEMEENGENIILGLIKGVINKEGGFSDSMEELAEKGISAFMNKMGSADLLEGMFNYSGITESKSAFDKVEDLSKNGAWEASNHTIHSYVDRWKAEGYESAEAWEAANKELDPLNSLLEDIAKQMGINIDETEELSEVTEALGDSASGTNEKLQEFRDELKDSIAQAMHNIFDEVSEQEYIDPEEMLYRMEENTRRVGEWARNIATLAARGMSEGLLNELKDMGPAGAAKVQAFVDMTDEQLEMANRRWRAADFLPDYGAQEIEQAYRNAGYNASLGFSDGVDLAGVKDTGIATGKAYDEGVREYLEIESPSQVMKENGEYTAEGLAIGLTDAKSMMLIKTQTTLLAKTLVNNLQYQLKPDIFIKIGENVTAGLNSGLSYNMQSILSKITAFAANIINTFQRILRIKSPSKAMEEIGAYTMEGFGVGFEEGADQVEKLSENSANDILNQMKEQIAAITNGWSEDNVYEPVIRPVFDMTSIDQGYNDIQSWFANSQGISLNGSISRLTPTRNDDTLQNQMLLDAIKNINNDDVVDEIVNLRNDISNLQSAMTNLQVVMNTGALVGQLVDPMDSALGAKSLMNSRGRY